MKSCFTLFILLLLTTFVGAQTNLLDHEGDTPEIGDFNSSVTTVIDNPDATGENTSGKVAQNVVPAGVAFAGSIRPLTVDLADGKEFTLQVWSPIANAPVLLKLEEGGAFIERVATASGAAMAWQTVTFNFDSEATRTWGNVTLFMNFNVVGGEELTFFYDNLIQQEGDGGGGGNDGEQVDLPVTFEDPDVDYSLVDFEGAQSMIVEDPTDASNTVVSTTKIAGAATFAGTTITAAGPPQTGFASRIALTEENSIMTVRVWSPTAGTPVRLKVENSQDPTVSVETEVNTTVAMQWDTLRFDFKNQADGTAQVNYASFYNKATIFFDFGTMPDAPATYFWDDVEFDGGDGGGGGDPNLVTLPVDFDNPNTNFDLGDFEGAMSTIVADPTDATNTVVQTIKVAGAATFAGTTLGATSGLGAPIELSADQNIVSIRVWSPTAGTPVRVKVENAANGAISVETEVNTTVAGQWETLQFDFRENAADNVVDYDAVYNKLTIFFDFGTMPAADATYYWEDVVLLGSVSVNAPITGVLGAYPNPVADRLTLTAPLRMDQVTVYSMTGAIVGTWAASADRLDLDVADFVSGTYVAIVVAGDQVYSIKFMRR